MYSLASDFAITSETLMCDAAIL